jgi:hypothetical protein
MKEDFICDLGLALDLTWTMCLLMFKANLSA